MFGALCAPTSRLEAMAWDRDNRPNEEMVIAPSWVLWCATAGGRVSHSISLTVPFAHLKYVGSMRQCMGVISSSNPKYKSPATSPLSLSDRPTTSRGVYRVTVRFAGMPQRW